MNLLIRFRREAMQLNEAEMKTVMHTFIESCTKNEITSNIFAYFYNQYLSKKSIHKLQNINSSISTIISNRKKIEEPAIVDDISMDDVDEEEQEPMSIYSLPTELVNKCSSYLEYHDHRKFGQCNRSIFISINSPLKLYHLDMTQLMKINNINNNIKAVKSMINNPNQYLSNPWIKALTFDFNTFIKFIDLNASFYENGVLKWFDIKLFIKSMEIKGINLSNIKHLTIDNKLITNSIQADPLCDFLKIFPNLVYLSIHFMRDRLRYSEVAKNAIIDKIRNLLPGLTMISTNMDSFLVEEMIKMRANQLVSLKYFEPLNINLTDFSKLRELHIRKATITELSASISKLPVLERLRMDNIYSDYTDYDMKMLTVGITKCKTLQYVGIYDNCRNCTLFARFLQTSFMETIKTKRERIKISINIKQTPYGMTVPIYGHSEFVDATKHLLDEMNIISVNWMDFMIRISFNGGGPGTKKWKTPEFITETVRKYENEYSIFQMDYFVIISNKNCKINGYRERWLNKSTNCNQLF